MIKKVYLWDNNAVTVFDENGAQLPQYQGMLSMVRDLILCAAADDAEYYLSSWKEASNKKITKEEFKGVK